MRTNLYRGDKGMEVKVLGTSFNLRSLRQIIVLQRR